MCKENGKAFYFDSWYQKSVQLIEHFYDVKNKMFYDFNYFSALYDIPNSDFLKYNSLKSSISRNIKSQMEVEDIGYTAPTYFFYIINPNTKLCKHAYQTLIKQNVPHEIKAQAKWKTTFLQDNIDWRYMYTHPIKLTNKTKLREF